MNNMQSPVALMLIQMILREITVCPLKT